MHSNFRLPKWNIYKAIFKVILINVPLALPARCSKIIRRALSAIGIGETSYSCQSSCNSENVGTKDGPLFIGAKDGHSISRASSSDPSAGWGTGTWAAPALHGHCWTTTGQGEHLSRTGTQTKPEWKWNIHYPTNRIIPAGFQTSNSSAINTVVHHQLQLWERAVALPIRNPEPAPQPREAAQRDSLHPSAGPRWNFPNSQLIQHRICQSHWTASSSSPQPPHLWQCSCLLSLCPRVWWPDNKTLVVFLKQAVHTQPEPLSQLLSLQTKLQRQAFSFLVHFFFFLFCWFSFQRKNLEMGAEEEKNIMLGFFSSKEWN